MIDSETYEPFTLVQVNRHQHCQREEKLQGHNLSRIGTISPSMLEEAHEVAHKISVPQNPMHAPLM